MTKISAKELIICIITIITLILVITTNAFAADDIEKLAGAVNNNNSEYVTIQENANKNTNNNINTNINKNTNINTNVNTNVNSNKNNTTIPNTGLDQSIMFIIVIFGISAVYAYKKIRDYKNV